MVFKSERVGSFKREISDYSNTTLIKYNKNVLVLLSIASQMLYI